MITTAPTRSGNHWVFPNGRRLPIISGGADEPEPEPADDVSSEAEEVRAELKTLRERFDKLEARREQRPQSTQKQLQEQLAEALGLRSDAAREKAEAKDITDSADAEVKKLARDIRSRDLRDAVTSAGVSWVDPKAAFELAMGRDDGTSNPDDIVTKIAKEFPSQIKKATEPDLRTTDHRELNDPGLTDLARSIQKSRS